MDSSEPKLTSSNCILSSLLIVQTLLLLSCKWQRKAANSHILRSLNRLTTQNCYQTFKIFYWFFESESRLQVPVRYLVLQTWMQQPTPLMFFRIKIYGRYKTQCPPPGVFFNNMVAFRCHKCSKSWNWGLRREKWIICLLDILCEPYISRDGSRYSVV